MVNVKYFYIYNMVYSSKYLKLTNQAGMLDVAMDLGLIYQALSKFCLSKPYSWAELASAWKFAIRVARVPKIISLMQVIKKERGQIFGLQIKCKYAIIQQVIKKPEL